MMCIGWSCLWLKSLYITLMASAKYAHCFIFIAMLKAMIYNSASKRREPTHCARLLIELHDEDSIQGLMATDEFTVNCRLNNCACSTAQPAVDLSRMGSVLSHNMPAACISAGACSSRQSRESI